MTITGNLKVRSYAVDVKVSDEYDHADPYFHLLVYGFAMTGTLIKCGIFFSAAIIRTAEMEIGRS
jgi:hypothetical protein